MFGTHAVYAAFQNENRQKHYLVLTENQLETWKEKFDAEPPLPFLVETNKFFGRLWREDVPQGIALCVDPLPEQGWSDFLSAHEADPQTLLALDHVQDPHNVGALMRSALALGAHGILVTSKHAAPLTSAVAKAAAGALDKLPVFVVPNLVRAIEEAKAKGFWCWGLSEDGNQSSEQTLQPQSRQLLVLGEEGKGLRSLTKEHVDETIALPTNPDFPTLNVSVAGAVALTLLKNTASSD